ncbi:hypothetical protein SAMN04488693_1263 [Arthrobacter subterraneus]|uniref:Uncharacterized protein n=1 Tax=Arthrobacter subterraneus TaxID=335973 RepID=A0A1G8NT03_9MICC|nr:hypothetical protein [Arthrobacter subterraneus]SDI83323.1 hypothetical protein SAMN04488693_1263 [Arthrobacter subterraneus]
MTTPQTPERGSSTGQQLFIGIFIAVVTIPVAAYVSHYLEYNYFAEGAPTKLTREQQDSILRLGVVIWVALTALGISFFVKPIRNRVWVAFPRWIWREPLHLFGLRGSTPAGRTRLVAQGRQEALAEANAQRNHFHEEGRKASLEEVEQARAALIQQGRDESLAEVESARDALVESGRTEVREEVRRARAAVQKPAFEIKRADWLGSDGEDFFYIRNYGASVARNVRLVAHEYWTPGNPVGLSDTFGNDPLVRGGVGKSFEGVLDDKALKEGNTFKVEYVDLNGDLQHEFVKLDAVKLARTDSLGKPLR